MSHICMYRDTIVCVATRYDSMLYHKSEEKIEVYKYL